MTDHLPWWLLGFSVPLNMAMVAYVWKEMVRRVCKVEDEYVRKDVFVTSQESVMEDLREIKASVTSTNKSIEQIKLLLARKEGYEEARKELTKDSPSAT